MAADSDSRSPAPHAPSEPSGSAAGIRSNCSHASCDVAVVGAGIIGLATALALADAGLCVMAFDRQLAMHEASWAAAGMLAANDPGNPAEIQELSRYSESLYPEFLARIEFLANIGTDAPPSHTIPLRTRRALEGIPTGHPLPSDPLSAAELERLAPGLATDGLQFISLDERSLDPCDFTRVLPGAARAAGVDLREHSPVLRVEREGEQYRVVFSSPLGEASVLARHVVFTTGAWSAPLPSSQVPVPSVVPRKGQLLALQLDGPVQTACVLRIPGLYIVPRGNGQYVVGATLENAGYDQNTSEPLLADLQRRAAALWAPLAHARRVAAWAGLRPESPDGLPLIGALGSNGGAEDPASANLWVAMGHFRNGILQAPGTARLLCSLILGQTPQVELERFRASRFAPQLHGR